MNSTLKVIITLLYFLLLLSQGDLGLFLLNKLDAFHFIILNIISQFQ